MDIRSATLRDAAALEGLFARIDTTHFRPHDMTGTGAMAVAAHQGRDVYLIGWLGPAPVAYGMLRGWDEGWSTPSLGIGVREGHRRHGHGRAMMEVLHGFARREGATTVRLRVSPRNRIARHLYDSLDHRAVGMGRGELLMVLDLS